MSSQKTFIKCLAHYHPLGVISNTQFEKSLDTSSEWIVDRTGIKERRFLNDYDGNFPGFELARRALEKLKDDFTYDFRNIGLIISAATHDDIHYPNPGNLISEQLKIDVPVFQIKVACSSVAYAIHLAKALLPGLSGKDVLIVNGEAFTKHVDYGDRSSCILFGDAGSAMIVSNQGGLFEVVDNEIGGKGLQIVQANRVSTTSHLSATDIISGELSHKQPRHNRRKDSEKKFQQDGKKVVEFVLTQIPEKVKNILISNKMTLSSLDFFICHQSNLNMMQQLLNLLEIPSSKHFYNVDRFGNTGSAGWITVLSEHQKNISSGSIGVIPVFGAGMTWSVLLLKRC